MKPYGVEIEGIAREVIEARNPKEAIEKVVTKQWLNLKVLTYKEGIVRTNAHVSKVSLLGGVRESVKYYICV